MRLLRALLVPVLVAVQAAPAAAFSQPPMNLGATSFLDGGGAPPGLYLVEYALWTDGTTALDKDGHAIPGGAHVTALTNLHQIYWKTDLRLFGAYLAFDVVVPVTAVTASGSFGPTPVTANRAGLGDLVVGPALQWPVKSFLGKPYLQQAEVFAILPTGRYDKSFAANPGANLTTYEAFYACTWLFAPAWEGSGRLMVDYHTKNGATSTQPGQAVHVNYAVSRELRPGVRLGASGYYLQQTSPDKVGGVAQPGSEERVFAVGPGVVIGTPNFTLMLSHPVESMVRNRFRGSRTSLELVLKF